MVNMCKNCTEISCWLSKIAKNIKKVLAFYDRIRYLNSRNRICNEKEQGRSTRLECPFLLGYITWNKKTKQYIGDCVS